MRRLIGAAAALGVCLSAAPGPPALDAVLRPVIENGTYAGLDLSVAFHGEADGQTDLRLPDAWGGERELWRALRDLRAQGAEIVAGADPARRILRHAPGARVAVSYRIVQDRPGAPRADGRNPYRPIVQPGYFHVLANTALATPDGIDQRGSARLRAEGMPAGAAFASDAQHPGLTVRGLAESVMVGGDFRVLDAGGGLRLAIRGTWPVADAAWRDRIARVGAAQRAYWGAAAEPYLVTVTQLAGQPEDISIGGTGREDGFAFFATPNAPADVVDRLLAHEMTHTWIPNRIGGLPERDEAADYWLSEGFADWASWRANVRGGVWRIEDFAAAFNAGLEAHDLSPAKAAPNARIVGGYWTDGDLQKLPYQRGMLIATWWDHRLRAASGGARDLDDVLRRMQAGAQRRPDVTAVKLLPEAMRRVAGVEIGVDLTELVAEGRPPPLPGDVFAPCGAIVAEQRAQWERGFDFVATQRADWVISGVTERSNAWRAGLRNGMRLRGWSERSDDRDPRKPVTATVDDAGVRRDIAWLPADGTVRTVRRLVLDVDMNAASRAACVRRLGGA
jgi:predicted metalloprotease with PDZ domain